MHCPLDLSAGGLLVFGYWPEPDVGGASSKLATVSLAPASHSASVVAFTLTMK